MRTIKIVFTVLVLSPGLVFAGNQKMQLDILIDALVVCPPGAPTRFVDNGDGTICDHQTGLMWEKKNANDNVIDFSNPHDVDNSYTWTDGGDGDVNNPDGTAFTDFLARLNGVVSGSGSSEQLGGYSDWRLPTIAELETIRSDPSCDTIPCVIDPVFEATLHGRYWSATSQYNLASGAWW